MSEPNKKSYTRTEAEYEDLERQLEERNQSHLELHQDYNAKYNECENLKRQLEEAREENDKLKEFFSSTSNYLSDWNKDNCSEFRALDNIENSLIELESKLKEQGDE